MTQVDAAAGAQDLLADLNDGVLTLTLNRPAARNALSRPMLTALADHLSEAELDGSVRCVVLTGAGSGFCAGGDVKAMTGGDEASDKDAIIHRQRVAQRATAGRLYKLPKPTLAVINGAAAGAGLSLALACDLRIMSTTAILTTAFARIGVSGDFGGTYFMTRLVGAAKARELFLLSERVSPEEALRLGLANLVCEPEVLATQAHALAARLARGPGVAYRYMKENLNRAAAGEIDDCLDVEATHHVHCTLTRDHREAVAAFVQKREPIFEGPEG